MAMSANTVDDETVALDRALHAHAFIDKMHVTVLGSRCSSIRVCCFPFRAPTVSQYTHPNPHLPPLRAGASKENHV
jgi:hypothetical protein